MWQPVATAPRDGSEIRIKGMRFESSRWYYADAVWAKRNCPAEIEGWFPPGGPDGAGDFIDVRFWRPKPPESSQ